MSRTTFRIAALAWLLAACSGPYANLPPEPPATYSRAEYALQHGEPSVAIAHYRTFLAATSDPTYRPRAHYQLAQAQFGVGQYQGTIETLAELESEFPTYNWPQVNALRGDAEHELGNRVAAFLAWEAAWVRASDADRAALRPRMEAAAAQLNEDELRELNELLTAPLVNAMIASRLPETPPEETAQETLDGGVLTGELAALPPLEAAPPEEAPAESAAPGAPEEAPPAAGEAASVGPYRVAARQEPEWPRIGCLLPLTGPDSSYGLRVLAGLRVAFADKPQMLVIRDTGGDPQSATRLFTALANDPTIAAVVGPVRSNEAEAVAPLAEPQRLPLVLLSQREGLEGQWVLQTAMTRREQIRRLVSHASLRMDVERFGILYPDDNYGRSFSELFRNEVKALGARVVGSQAYVPGQPEFSAEVEEAASWKAQAIFIPDNARTASTLGSALRAAAPQLVLLGTESWNRPATLAGAGHALDGAVFADAFFAGSQRLSTRAFVERFEEQIKRPPTVFEAQAYDSAMLARKAIEAGAATRDDMLAQMRSIGQYEGAAGVVATSDGVQRELFLLRVNNGRVEEIVPAGREG